jgi:hypothetical protein
MPVCCRSCHPIGLTLARANLRQIAIRTRTLPPRTNQEQEVIALLRRLLAREGCEVTESAMLYDRVARTNREVDVVIRCPMNEDATITLSCEVVDHKHPKDIKWVEQQISKHARLETNILMLVSWSGFTKSALELGGASTEPVTQMIHVQRDVAGSISLFQDEVSLTPRKVVFVVDSPRGTLRVKALIAQALFWASGEQLREDAAEMVRGLLSLPHVVKMTLTEAHNHPERESLRWFQFHTRFPETLQLYLREEPSQELHRIVEVQIEGELEFKQSALDLQVARFGEILFGHARMELAGRPGMIVARLGEEQELLPGRVVRVYPKDEEPKPARANRRP